MELQAKEMSAIKYEIISDSTAKIIVMKTVFVFCFSNCTVNKNLR